MEKLSFIQLKEFLDEKYDLYNRPAFIETDPIQIPHRFARKEDIEIAAFLSSTIAWGRRNSIIKNASTLMDLMGDNPFDFVINSGNADLKTLEKFVHRTFNGIDCIFFINSLKNIYINHGGLEEVFLKGYKVNGSIKESLSYFRNVFFETTHLTRSEKHIANVIKNSSAKRLNLFLMWMVRNDMRKVHFGLWKNIRSADLYLPLDVHTANTGRKLGIIKRKQNDWTTVEEITGILKELDPLDPVKYDFALFGLSIIENF